MTEHSKSSLVIRIDGHLGNGNSVAPVPVTDSSLYEVDKNNISTDSFESAEVENIGHYKVILNVSAKEQQYLEETLQRFKDIPDPEISLGDIAKTYCRYSIKDAVLEEGVVRGTVNRPENLVDDTYKTENPPGVVILRFGKKEDQSHLLSAGQDQRSQLAQVLGAGKPINLEIPEEKGITALRPSVEVVAVFNKIPKTLSVNHQSVIDQGNAEPQDNNDQDNQNAYQKYILEGRIN